MLSSGGVATSSNSPSSVAAQQQQQQPSEYVRQELRAMVGARVQQQPNLSTPIMTTTSSTPDFDAIGFSFQSQQQGNNYLQIKYIN